MCVCVSACIFCFIFSVVASATLSFLCLSENFTFLKILWPSIKFTTFHDSTGKLSMWPLVCMDWALSSVWVPHKHSILSNKGQFSLYKLSARDYNHMLMRRCHHNQPTLWRHYTSVIKLAAGFLQLVSWTWTHRLDWFLTLEFGFNIQGKAHSVCRRSMNN